MSLPYRLYLAKQAAGAPEQPYTPSTILRYPWRGNKPADINELADRREALAAKVGIGATVGAGIGLLARRAIPRHASSVGDYLHLTGPLIGASLGAVGGAATHVLTSTLDKVKKHQEAVDDYYAHGGKPLPFLVRHPYLAAFAAPLAAGPIGAAGGVAISKALGRGALEGLALGSALSSSLAQPMINHFRRQQLKETFPNLKLKDNEIEDTDSIYVG